MDLNKISVKQQGGQMIPQQPGMQQQPQVDPAIQQISMFFKQSVEQGMKPEEVVMGLIQKEVDQNTIVQALMSVGYQENDLQVLFQNIQEQQQPADPTAQQINQDPQQLARQQEIQEGQEGLNVNIDPIQMAKSGIEIKPENEGKFTAWAKARGMGVQEAARKVMANKDRYPTRIVKMANFAKNAAGWNKQEGGTVEIQKLSEDGKNIITERDGMTILTDNPYDNQDAKSQVNLNNIEIQIKLLQQQAAIAKAQEEAAAKLALLEMPQQKQEGGEFKPHFMYKGKRKIRAKDMETHLRLKEAGYTHDAPKAKTGEEVVVSTEEDKVIDNGTVYNPTYISPSAFHTGKRFSPSNLVNSVMDFGTTLFGGQDNNQDGVKDGTFRDLKKKTLSNKINKYANAGINLTNIDTSDDNLANIENFLTQYRLENPNIGDAIENLPEIKTNENDLNNVIDNSKTWLKENVGDLGKGAQGLYDALFNMTNTNTQSTQTPGIIPEQNKGFQIGGEKNEPLIFKEWVMQDPITRGTANAQQEYQSYVDNFVVADVTESPDADSLFQKINMPELDFDFGGVSGALTRAYDSNAMRGFEGITGKAIPIISNINDYLEDKDDSGYVDAFNKTGADFAYGTDTDPMFKKGKGPDINTGLFGPDSDKVTGYTDVSKYGGGTNNAGFKALPKNVQANILQNMQGGGTPGQQIPGMPTKAQLDALTGANKIEFVPRTPQYEYLASLPEQSVDFQLPNFVKGSSYNQMLVTRLFKDSELMKLPSQSENFQLDNFKKMQRGGTPGKQIPGTPTKEELDLLVYLNKFNKGFMADGYKPSQEEFDKMTQEERELYSESFPQNYKIGSDTPSALDLYKLNYSNSFMANGSRPNQSEFDTMSQSQKETYAESFPGFYKISSDTPTKEELDAITNKMEMGGNPFNPLKLFTSDLEEYQDKGETPRRRTRTQAEEERSAIQNQLNTESQRIDDYRSNISKIYKGIQTAENAKNENISEEEKQKRLDEVLGDSNIKRSIFNYSGDNSYYGPVFGLDTVAKPTRDWVDSVGSGCTTFGCGIMREAGATTADGSPFPYIAGNSELNSYIENDTKNKRTRGGLQTELMPAGFTDLKPGDRIISNYGTDRESGDQHTMIFTGEYNENGSPIMMENSGGVVQGGVNYRSLYDIKDGKTLANVDDGLRVSRYMGSTGDLNKQLSTLQAELDAGRFYQDPSSITTLDPYDIEPLEISTPSPDMSNLQNLMRQATGGEQGEAAYLANIDRVIKREMAKAKKGGETVNVDPRMLAKLIAAGADIEML